MSEGFVASLDEVLGRLHAVDGVIEAYVFQAANLVVVVVSDDKHRWLMSDAIRKVLFTLDSALDALVINESEFGSDAVSPGFMRIVRRDGTILHNDGLWKHEESKRIPLDDFVVRRCTEGDLGQVLSVQEEVFGEMGIEDIVRRNTGDMLRECLTEPNVTLGAWYGGELVAFGVLYFPHTEYEDLSRLLVSIDTAGLKAANFKLFLVKKRFRGNALQYFLGGKLEPYAAEASVNLLCATVAPENTHSVQNFEMMRFTLDSVVARYNSERGLYFKKI